ncbi:MAG: aromatic-ring-hydroxylating dioxygenase subunit beta [Burkholderiales bacterium]
MNKTEARHRVEELIREYAACIDDGRYEEWPEMFTEECRYLIIPRESYERGYVSGFYLCESRGMLKDRILCLRETAIYEPQHYRHLIGGTRVLACSSDGCRAETPFSVIRTTQDGAMSLFAAGKYVDDVVFEGDKTSFREKLVLTDSTRIDILIAAPL